MRLSIIRVDGEIRNMYINTGYYAIKVAKEMKKQVGGAEVEVLELDCSEEFMSKFNELLKTDTNVHKGTIIYSE